VQVVEALHVGAVLQSNCIEAQESDCERPVAGVRAAGVLPAHSVRSTLSWGRRRDLAPAPGVRASGFMER
ncbi:hypothetical protein, partial [Brucella gallinifaecis]|uniref:hypothetical protein n=1 Tax=Brucella gallinifaecis TaxID=215590 RepID=UPI0023630214